MSLFLDQKYLLLISNRLPLFTKKTDHTYNCRCIICGDSAKKLKKARGYFFPNKNELMYKCHNCGASMFFGKFLKLADNLLYQQYSLEKYSEGSSLTSNTKSQFKFEQPVFKNKQEKILDNILLRLDKLNEDNEVVKFCIERKIPKEKFKLLYCVESIKNIVELNEKYRESIKGEEPRLVLPFYDSSCELSAVTCRAVRGEALRYITVKIKDDSSYFFGIENINRNKTVYAVEGPIDSLFVDNAIAVAGTSFGKLNELKLKDLVVVLDNQPRNKEIITLLEKTINNNTKVVIWPQSIEEKDINEMVLAGRNVKKILEENTFQGLHAKAKMIAWKRV